MSYPLILLLKLKVFNSSPFHNFPLLLSSQAEFPANTNILYVDLPSAELVGSSKSETCLPGMVLNVKKPIVYVDHFGDYHRYIHLLTFASFLIFTLPFRYFTISVVDV